MKPITTVHLLNALITASLILLWTYASVSKLIDHQKFFAGLQKVTAIGNLGVAIGFTIIFSEIILVAALLVPRFQLAGFIGSVFLLIIFSGYILYLLNYAPHLPCTCGGIIQRLSWRQHLILNISFIILCVAGIRSQKMLHQAPSLT